jgi:hypothetical protein
LSTTRIKTKSINIRFSLFVFYIIFAGISIIIIPSAFGQPFQQQPLQQQPFQQQSSSFSNTYTDPQGTFTLNYPSDWSYSVTPIPIFDKNALMLMLMSPKYVSLFEINIPMPSHTTNENSASILNSFLKCVTSRMQNPFVLQSIECNNYMLSGEKACSSIIGDYENNIPIIALFVGTAINGNAHVFMATGLTDDFYSELPTILPILSSFQINN